MTEDIYKGDTGNKMMLLIPVLIAAVIYLPSAAGRSVIDYTEREFDAAWQSQDRVFILMPKSRLGRLQSKPAVTVEALDRVLIRNH